MVVLFCGNKFLFHFYLLMNLDIKYCYRNDMFIDLVGNRPR
jgi:hypothetical protein